MNKFTGVAILIVLIGGVWIFSHTQNTQSDTAMEGADVSVMEKTTLLAGSSSPLFDFTKSEYDKAIMGDKLVVLYFYANWCPLCRAEFPKMQAAFDALSSDSVIGFRVNYNDSDTDSYEKDLARQFGVAYQHTKVFLKNGTQVLKSPESWDEARYTAEITKSLQ